MGTEQPKFVADSLLVSIRNAAKQFPSEFQLQLPSAASIAQIKLRLQQQYPGNPEPQTQTVTKH